MKNRIILLIMFIILTSLLLPAQDNIFQIDNELYDRYMRCQKVLKEKRVLAMADTLFQLAKRKGDVKAQCLALHVECDHYYTTEDIPGLSASIRRMKDFAIKTSYQQYIFSAWGRKISYYTQRNMYDDALLELNAYQAEAIRLRNVYGITYSYKKQADIYAIRNDYVKAIELYEKAIAYSKENHDTKNLYELYTSLGRCYMSIEKYDSAIMNLQIAMDIVPNEEKKLAIYLGLASLNLKKEKLEEAKAYLLKAEALWEKYPVYNLTRETYFETWIRYFGYSKNYEKALALTDSLADSTILAKNKSVIYELSKDYEQAYHWSLIHMKLYRRYLNDETNARIAELTSRFDNERLTAEKNRLALENSLLQLQQTKNRNRLLENEQQLLKSEKERTQLDLDNQKLVLHQQQIELEKSHKDALYQEEVAKTMQLHSRQNFILSLTLGAILILVSLFSFSYMVLRQRSMLRLKKEKKIAEDARLQAEESRGQAEMARTQAEKARQYAENANMLKSLFLQNMSHEIRTPLNAIVGFTDVLNDPDMDLEKEERYDFLEQIHTNTDLLLTLINDILDMSKLESGTYTLNMSPVKVSDVCRSVLASVTHRAAPNVKLRFELPSDTDQCPDGSFASELILHTDSARLQQILTNFLTNACKYTEHGSIVLTYTIRENLKENRREVVFSVTDTGSGIPSEKAEKIFERFEKLDSFKQGTGLGLNICRRIADLVGGQVYVDTSYTDGARFVFVHPIIS